MLAAFDSDSESDNGESTTQKPNSNFLESLKSKLNPTRGLTMDLHSDEEDEDIIMPRGRMAARLQGKTTDDGQTPSTETAFERVSKTLRAKEQDADSSRRDSLDDDDEDSSDDDLPAAGPRRRPQIAEMSRDEDAGSVRSRSRSRSFSPLFVSSPTRPPNDHQQEGNSADLGNEDAAPKKNSRFLELVAQKRREREEKERIEAEKKAAKAKEMGQLSANMFSDDESADDGGSGRKMPSRESRPARKASKKALEEMNRETQRMSRSMQLAHQAQTKKKITKESFFARFNFMQPQEQIVSEQPGENSSTTADSQHSSDVELQKDKETPHTSPVLPAKDAQDDSIKETAAEEFPTLDQLMSEPDKHLPEKVEEQAKPNTTMSEVKKGKMPMRVAPVRVRFSREQVAQHQKDDSDSDLEIVTSPAKCRRIAAFENLPVRHIQEPAYVFKLKALAQLTSPTRKSMMNSAELSATLLYKAKQQAAQERKERIEELRVKGIVIETAAERAAFEDEIENLVEKARQEGEEIAKREREAKKIENGGDLDDDDDDSDFEISGSEEEDNVDEGDNQEEEEEDEDDEEEEEDEEQEGVAKVNGEDNLIDSEAGEDNADESEDDEMVEPTIQETEVPTQRRKRLTRIISDDEDEDEDQAPKTPARPINPFLNSVERPNIPVKPSEAIMSLTQAFAGTLAPSQDMSQEDTSTIPQSLPEPVPMSMHDEPDSQIIIKDSQEQRAGSMDPFAGYSLDARISESPAPRSISQMSQIPDPTQDAGFVLSPFDPNKRFLGTPTSTIETVLIERNQSPVTARNTRNLKRGKAPGLSAIQEQEEDEEDEGAGRFEIDASAFDVMKKAAKKKKW